MSLILFSLFISSLIFQSAYVYLACDACLDSDIKNENRSIQQTLNGMLGKVKLGLIYAAE